MVVEAAAVMPIMRFWVGGFVVVVVVVRGVGGGSMMMICTCVHTYVHPSIYIHTSNQTTKSSNKIICAGVPKASTMTEIKKAYRRKVVRMHPDKVM